jgi:hypothetical protein
MPTSNQFFGAGGLVITSESGLPFVLLYQVADHAWTKAYQTPNGRYRCRPAFRGLQFPVSDPLGVHADAMHLRP